MTLRRKVGGLYVAESAYLERNSFESRYPNDPWLKYRLPNGDFAEYLHLFVTGTTSLRVGLQIMQLTVPKPMIFEPGIKWDELMAFYNVGYFKNAPHPWPAWEPHPYYREHPSVYAVALNRNTIERFQLFLDGLKKQTVCDVDLLALLNDKYLITRREDENFGSYQDR